MPAHCPNCKGTRLEVETLGAVYYNGGELHDTLKDYFFCLDCGEYVIPEQDAQDALDAEELPW